MIRLLGVLLTVLFVYLKISGQVDWSWWIVMSPLIAAFVIVFIMLFIIHFMMLSKKPPRFR